MAVIELEKVTKMYGDVRGIENVSLKVDEGVIFGFLGPNGAGKTTTISLLVDLIRPTKGKIKIFGLDSVADSVQIRRRVGFLAGDFALDSALTGLQQLEYFGHLRGSFNQKYVAELAERLSINLNIRFKNLSRGNRQKIGLISALMHDPELLIFDEPTSGLDPLIQAEFNKIIVEHKQRGKTAFVSSHVLSEVQTLCEEVAFVRGGRLIDVKKLQHLAAAGSKFVRIVSSDKKLISALSHLEHSKIQTKTAGQIDLTISGDLNPLLTLLARHKVSDVTISEVDLETIFMHYYQEETNA